MKKWLIILSAVAVLMCGCHRKDEQQVPEGFKAEVMLGITPVKNQGKSELCWVYAMLATIETEHLMQGDSVNLSTDYIARLYLEDLALNYFDSKGESNMSMRGVGPMTLQLLRKYGAMPYDSYSPHKPVNYSVLVKKVKQTVELALSHKKSKTECQQDVERLLNENIGYLPKMVFMYGIQYTTKEFAHSVCGKHEYKTYTSIASERHYENIILPFSDNHFGCLGMNISPKQLVAKVESNLRAGHPVMWEGGPNDNHAVAIIGMGRDKDGREYFVAKNSWGTDNPTHGMMYIQKSYVMEHTAMIVAKL